MPYVLQEVGPEIVEPTANGAMFFVWQERTYVNGGGRNATVRNLIRVESVVSLCETALQMIWDIFF